MELKELFGKASELVVHWQCAVLAPDWGELAMLLGSPHIRTWRWQHVKDAVDLLPPWLTVLAIRGALGSSRQHPPSHATSLSPLWHSRRGTLGAYLMTDK